MNLIERYAHEVGKNLPTRQRPDIEAEIRSMIEDMLEEKSQQANRPVDDEMINTALKELGNPEKLAASYLPARYLIGPRLYPTFIQILKIVLTVLGAVAVVGLGIRIGTGDLVPQAIIQTMLRSIGGYFQTAVITLGYFVITFAILERVMPPSAFEEGKAEWTPDELVKEPDPEEVKTWESIVAIVVTLAGLLILNFYPQWMGIHFPQDGGWVSVPLLSQAFFRALPLINIGGLLTVLLNVILLRRRRWEGATRWFSFGLDLWSVAIAALLLSGPSILALTPETLAEAQIPSETAELLVSMLNPIVKGALVLAIAAGGLEAFKKVIRIAGKWGEGKHLPI